MVGKLEDGGEGSEAKEEESGRISGKNEGYVGRKQFHYIGV